MKITTERWLIGLFAVVVLGITIVIGASTFFADVNENHQSKEVETIIEITTLEAREVGIDSLPLNYEVRFVDASHNPPPLWLQLHSSFLEFRVEGEFSSIQEEADALMDFLVYVMLPAKLLYYYENNRLAIENLESGEWIHWIAMDEYQETQLENWRSETSSSSGFKFSFVSFVENGGIHNFKLIAN